MNRILAVTATIAALAYAVMAPANAPTPDDSDPYRYCVNGPDNRLDCYLNGDVPQGSVIVWAGLTSDIPR